MEIVALVPASFDTTNFFARIDHSINRRHQLGARYSLYHINTVKARVQFTNSRLDAPVNDEVGPAVGISGVTNFGTATVRRSRVTLTCSNLAGVY